MATALREDRQNLEFTEMKLVGGKHKAVIEIIIIIIFLKN